VNNDSRLPEETGANLAITPVIAVHNLTKTYMPGQTRVRALQGISLAIHQGEFVAVMGPSGSGKSTFMNLVGCLDRPTQGEYWLTGKLVSRLSSDELADIRNRLIGFVFQGFNLLSRMTALGNVMLPMVYAGASREERELHGRRILRLVGLGDRMDHKPSELSGGQQQRVAIARALVNGPSLLLADEPTGNLDSRTSLEIMAVLQALNEQGLTIVLVTHERDIAKFAKREVAFRDGRIVRDEPVLTPASAKEEWTKLVKKGAEEHKVQVKEETR
jgi:putative ABC transport system ATP-binding protein